MKLIAATLALFFSTSAFAAEIDFSAVITDQDGTPITDCAGAPKECEGKPPLTLGKIAMRALTASYEDERTLSGEEKFKRGRLAERVYSGGQVSLTAEDVALIKRLIAKGFGPLIVFKSWPLLDSASPK